MGQIAIEREREREARPPRPPRTAVGPLGEAGVGCLGAWPHPSTANLRNPKPEARNPKPETRNRMGHVMCVAASGWKRVCGNRANIGYVRQSQGQMTALAFRRRSFKPQGVPSSLGTHRAPGERACRGACLGARGCGATRCRANMAHIRQARPDFGLGLHMKVFKSF